MFTGAVADPLVKPFADLGIRSSNFRIDGSVTVALWASVGTLTIDEQVSAAAQVPSEDGKPRQRFLGNDPQLVRQRREDHRRVVDALVIRDEDVGLARRDAIESFYGDFDARGFQDEPRPRAGAGVREVSAAIDDAGHDRRGAEHDCVEGDGGDQIEHGQPPVERRNAQVRKDNVLLFV